MPAVSCKAKTKAVITVLTTSSQVLGLIFFSRYCVFLDIMSSYIFLDLCLLRQTIWFLYFMSDLLTSTTQIRSQELSPSFQPWQAHTLPISSDSTAGVHFQHLYLYSSCILLLCTLSSAPSFLLQPKTSHGYFKAHTGSPKTVYPYHTQEVLTDQCATTTHNRFLFEILIY